jgi:hypothetical protein
MKLLKSPVVSSLLGRGDSELFPSKATLGPLRTRKVQGNKSFLLCQMWWYMAIISAGRRITNEAGLAYIVRPCYKTKLKAPAFSYPAYPRPPVFLLT